MIISHFPQGGGGGTKPGQPPGPVQVYKATRPADWLPMPAEADVLDNEIYLLFHIPDGVSSLIAFTVTCTGNYTVALGAMINGAFVQKSGVSIASGATYEAELMAADYGDLTSTGMKQVMIKVSGTDILTWEQSGHSKRPSVTSYWNIVEIACRLTKGKINLQGGYFRYFSWYGTNSLADATFMFKGCNSLEAVLELDTSKVRSMESMFSECYCLTCIPKLDTANVTNMSRMFEFCGLLRSIPQLDTSKVTNMAAMFFFCETLISIPKLNTSKVTNMGSMFQFCTYLVDIPKLDTANVTDMSSMFGSCQSLRALPELNTTNVIDMAGIFQDCYSLIRIHNLDIAHARNLNVLLSGCSSLEYVIITASSPLDSAVLLEISGDSLGRQALKALFERLPVGFSEFKIYIYNCPAAAELTDADKAIATEKGWELIFK